MADVLTPDQFESSLTPDKFEAGLTPDRFESNPPGKPRKIQGMGYEPGEKEQALRSPWESNPILAATAAPAMGTSQVMQGVGRAATASNLRDVAGGASDIIRGGLTLGTAFYGPRALLQAPLRIPAAAIAGGVAQQAIHAAGGALGVPDEYSSLAGDVAGLAAGTAAFRTLPKARISRPTNPVQGFHDALKPGSSDYGAQETFQTAVPELKATNSINPLLADPKSAAPGETVKSAVDLSRATEHRLMDLWDAKRNPQIMMGATISGPEVGARMEASIPREAIPHVSEDLKAEIQWYKDHPQVPFDQAESFLHTGNAEVNSLYSKSPEGFRVTMASPQEIAIKEARNDALRDLIYNKASDYDQGASSREIMRRWGAVREMRGMFEQRRNEAIREVPNPLQRAFELYRGGKQGLVQAGINAASPPDTIDQGVWKAFQNFNGLPAPIEIASRWGEIKPQIRGLLPGASVPQTPSRTPWPNPNQTFQMGSGPDASGPISPTLPSGIRIRPDWAAEGRIDPSRQITAPVIEGQPGPMPRGRYPQMGTGPSTSPISGAGVGATPQAITPPAYVSLDDVANYAQQNLLTFGEATMRLRSQGYQIRGPSYGR